MKKYCNNCGKKVKLTKDENHAGYGLCPTCGTRFAVETNKKPNIFVRILRGIGFGVCAIVCGNVNDSTLEEVYFQNETLRRLRAFTVPQACRNCTYQLLCKGGARCQSYSAYNSFCRADPACPNQDRD